jgi:hypothetical protein
LLSHSAVSDPTGTSFRFSAGDQAANNDGNVLPPSLEPRKKPASTLPVHDELECEWQPTAAIPATDGQMSRRTFTADR